MYRLRLSLAQRFPALASRDFTIFGMGYVLSLIGTSMQNTAQPLLAYRLSESPFDLGLIGFAVTLPTFFFAIPGGVIIEHLDKRRTVIAMQYIMMADSFVLAFLTLSGRIQIWHLVVLSLILGFAMAFEITARQAMLIELVGRAALPNAIALQSTALNLSRVLGPALVAPILLFFKTNGEGWVFLFNGLSFIAIVIGLFFVHPQYHVPVETHTRPLLDEFREGAHYLIKHSSVGLIIVIAAILGVFAYPILQQLPIVSQDLLGQVGDTRAAVDMRNSLIYTAQGVGALVAAFIISVDSSARRSGSRMLLGAGAFILGMIVIPFCHSIWPAMIVIALLGWGSVTQLATMNTLIQIQVPDSLRGRVFSIYLWALQGVAPFGNLLMGGMAQTITFSNTVQILGVGCLVVIGAIHGLRPDVGKSEG